MRKKKRFFFLYCIHSPDKWQHWCMKLRLMMTQLKIEMKVHQRSQKAHELCFVSALSVFRPFFHPRTHNPHKHPLIVLTKNGWLLCYSTTGHYFMIIFSRFSAFVDAFEHKFQNSCHKIQEFIGARYGLVFFCRVVVWLYNVRLMAQRKEWRMESTFPKFCQTIVIIFKSWWVSFLCSFYFFALIPKIIS